MLKREEHFMNKALFYAKKAFDIGEIPVGAVIVMGEKIIASGYNKREFTQNALLHAEIDAINKACKKLKSFRLDDCEMFVTLEPCPMCAGAIISARLKKVYIGAMDKNYGCCGSRYNLLQDKNFENTSEVQSGILKSRCENLLLDFFIQVRSKNKLKKFLGSIVLLKEFNYENNFLIFKLQDNLVKGLFLESFTNNANYYIVAIVERFCSKDLIFVLSNDKKDYNVDIIYDKLKNNFSEKIKITNLSKTKKVF